MSAPEKIQISTAAALALGLKPGVFYRGAKLHCLNLLLTYEKGCVANCAYCGLSRSRDKSSTFIRVAWPIYPLEKVLTPLQTSKGIERVCISMVTHPKAAEDTVAVIKEIKKYTQCPVSVLVSPTLINKEDMRAMKEAGAERAGVAVDAATEVLFDYFRGRGVNGPHKWAHYWKALEDALEVFGPGMAGVHLIVGLDETEEEMVTAIQRGQDMGAPTHLFSFFPENGTREALRQQPPLDVYRRIQIARFLINQELSSKDKMSFGDTGKVTDFGVSADTLDEVIDSGLPFRTSGCPGKEPCVSACNRPYGNERPSEAIRNFPFAPNDKDISDVRSQLYKEQ